MLTKFLNEEISSRPDLLLCIGGSSGSGKTTLAQILSYSAHGEDWRNFMFAADDYFTSEGGKYDFDPTKLGEAHNDCQARVDKALTNKVDEGYNLVIVHNTFTAEEHYAPYKAMAKKHGWLFKIVWVGNHHGSKDVHDVPAKSVEMQSKAISELLYKLGTRPHGG